ncbi:MAG: hypothetical protein CMK49_01450 [Prochlorococcus sp. SP3034]|nr:hypothetical protein [Prochlorococcus sp. SP3034]|tara:strand:- start:3439 stop:3684 length:246 start_codon:yes stop_codon:yes gene_type:complete
MNKGFSNNQDIVESELENKDKPKKGLSKILAEKKFTYTLPGKRQINIFATVVLSLNFLMILGVILFFKNQSFHDFIFNVGK